MRRLIIVFTLLIILLSAVASVAGILGPDGYRTVTSVRGESVEVQDAGIYRHSVRAFVLAGVSWDWTRLLLGIPVLFASLILYLRGSLRGTAVFIGSLASFLYQYLLWAFGWAFNGFFLVYVAVFSLSLCTLALVLVGVDRAEVRGSISERFPVIAAAVFSFALGGALLLKCLGELLPTICTGAMPAVGAGFHTMVDQGLDLGLLVPLCIGVGALLIRREPLGYLLSASTLMLGLTVGSSVVAGELRLGLSTGRMNVGGIAAFSVFLGVGLALLARVLLGLRKTGGARPPSTGEPG
jgi:hypothetical protein